MPHRTLGYKAAIRVPSLWEPVAPAMRRPYLMHLCIEYIQIYTILDNVDNFGFATGINRLRLWLMPYFL